jgi:hypothetical protein
MGRRGVICTAVCADFTGVRLFLSQVVPHE